MSFYQIIYKLFSRPVRAIWRVSSEGAENIPEGGCILVSNHTAMMDVLVLEAASPRQIRFMAKKELFKIPLLNILIRALGAYPVNRGGADVSAIKHTIEMLKGGAAVGMFPQGHRYNGVDPRTTTVKTGAAMIAQKAGVQVLPVFVKVKNNKHFFLCKKEVIVGKPISVEEMNYNPEAPGEYQRIADYLFEKVCELGD